MPLLGQVPLVPELRAGGDSGRPIVLTEPDGEAAQAFARIAEQIEVELAPTRRYRKELKLLVAAPSPRGRTPVPSSWWTTAPGAEEAFPPEDRPVGRRVVLGMLALGGVGHPLGRQGAAWMEATLRPLTIKDQTGLSSFLPSAGRFRIYTVTGTLPGGATRSTG